MYSSALALQHEFLGVNSCIFIVGLLACLLISAVIKRYQIYQLPESAAFMIVGFIGGCLAQFSSEAERQFITFSPNLVFFIILPPIILDAGYTLKRKDFFDSLAPVTLLATVGTVVNNIAFGYLMYAFAKAGWIPLETSSPLECLLFGALVSATDPVATLSLMGSRLTNTDPMLYSLVMGESVLNDAVAIVLYKAFESSVATPDGGDLETDGDLIESVTAKPFHFGDLVLSLLSFLGVSLGSVAVGAFVGLACSLLCKRVNLRLFPISELSLVTLFAYLSYFLAEVLTLSGIMSLFFCSICLAHYNYYNLTTIAQVALHESFKSNAQIAETALYALLGISAGLSIRGSFVQYHMPLIVLTILVALIARAVHVFPLSWFANMSRSPDKQIGFRMQIPLWFAGLRGGIAFALSLGFPGPHRALIMGATLMLVLFTTFVGGGLTLPLLRATGMTKGTADGIKEQQGRLQQNGEHTEDSIQSDSHQEHESDAPHLGLETVDLDDDDNDDPPSDLPLPSSHSHSAPVHDPSSSSSSSSSRVHGGGLFNWFQSIDERYLRQWFGSRDTSRTEDGTMRPIQSIPTPVRLTRRAAHLTAHVAALSPGSGHSGVFRHQTDKFRFDASPIPLDTLSSIEVTDRSTVYTPVRLSPSSSPPDSPLTTSGSIHPSQSIHPSSSVSVSPSSPLAVSHHATSE